MGCPKAVPPSLLLCWWLSTAHSWFLLPHPRGCAGTRCGSEGLLPNADILGFALSGRTAGAENKAGFPARPGCFHCKQQIRSGLNQTEIIPGPGDLHRCKPNQTGPKTVSSPPRSLREPGTDPARVVASTGGRKKTQTGGEETPNTARVKPGQWQWVLAPTGPMGPHGQGMEGGSAPAPQQHWEPFFAH